MCMAPATMPLIGQTIGEYLDAAVAALPRCDALVVAPAEGALDLSRAAAARRRLRGRAAGARARARRPHRHLVAEQRGMGDHPVRHRQGRAHPGQHQSGLPPGRARIRAEQGRLQGADHGDRAQDQRLHRHAQRSWRRSWRRASRAQLKAAKLPDAAHAHPASAATSPGMLAFDDDRRRLAHDSHRAQPAGSSRAELQFDDPINIQFTSGTTGFPKGATLTHHNILNNGFFIGETMRLDREGPPLHSRAALSLLRHGAGQPRLRHPWRRHGLSRRGLRSAGGAGDRRRTSAAPASTACPPCSSPNSAMPSSSASTSPRCAPASWRARPVRSR